MNKLVERKNIFKTKKYFDSFESICKYEFVEDMKDLFSWHKEVIKDFNKIDRVKFFPTFSVENDIDFNSFWEKIDNIISSCSAIFYMMKNGILVRVTVDKIKYFIQECFEKQNSYDAFLMFLNPSKIVAFCENEYDVDFLCVSDE